MHQSPPRVTRAINRTLTSLLAAALIAAGCATSDAPSGADPSPGDEVTAERTPPTAVIDGSDLVLTSATGDRTVVATVDDAELLHAEVRPGVDDPVTILALTRADDRYELRYLSVYEDQVTDLYWFPARLQVSPDTVHVSDVPTLPVWAPDGSELAWLEWDDAGTRLRTVGWFDHDLGTNPSDDQATYEVDDLPVGTQLATWEVDEDGTPVLVTRGEGDDRWRIRLEEDEPVVALDAPS